jgi:hypothetical protein
MQKNSFVVPMIVERSANCELPELEGQTILLNEKCSLLQL